MEYIGFLLVGTVVGFLLGLSYGSFKTNEIWCERTNEWKRWAIGSDPYDHVQRDELKRKAGL